MFYSQCILNSIRPINPYVIHKKIWRLFPNIPMDLRPFLYRIENPGQNGIQYILLQSDIQPQAAKGDLVLLHTKAAKLNLQPQQNYRFLLRANPCIKLKSKRVPLVGNDSRIAWLTRQLGTAASLQTENLGITQQQLSFRKPKTGDTSEHFGKIATVCYSGILTAQNAAELQQKISRGVGSAKVFGCGLLSLAKG